MSLSLSCLFSSFFVYSGEGPWLDPDDLDRCASSSSSPVISFRPLETCNTSVFIRTTVLIDTKTHTTIGIAVLVNQGTCATFLLVITLFGIITVVCLGLGWRGATGQQVVEPIPKRQSLPPPDLVRPPVYPLAPRAYLESLNLDALHPRRVLQPDMTGHAAGVCSLLWNELQHGDQEIRNALRLILLEVVLLPQDVGQRPVAQPVDITQLALAVEYLLRPLTRQAQ